MVLEDAQALVARYESLLRKVVRERLALERGFGPADVDDALQRLWLRLLEKGGPMASYDSARPLRPFLMGVALNVCRDYLKAERPRRSAGESSVPAASEKEEPSRILEARERQALLHQALEKLSVRDRLILQWLDLDGLPAREVAGLLGVPERSVSTLAFRARRRLKEILPPES